MEIDEKLRGFVVGSVPTVIYIPEFIDEAEETQIFNNIYQAPISKWKSLKNRRLQNWGSERWHIALMTYTCALPHQDGPAYFPAAAILSLGSPVVMNFTPHLKLSESNGTTETGAVSQTSENAAVVSLDNPSSFSLLLMPRSLLVFKDLAYSDYLHGIEDNAVQSFEGAANLTRVQNDSGVNEQLLSLTCAEATESGDGKILHRTTKRVSLTCRLVLKVRKI
ncbi:Alpha-ketoglutarate-dependent dioxygenase alkB-like protein 6 [Bienertia sinuspersici]